MAPKIQLIIHLFLISAVAQVLVSHRTHTVAKELIKLDRVPDELWTEVRDIVQETRIKTIPKKKKCRKAKWLSEEALQIAEKRKVKRNGGKER